MVHRLSTAGYPIREISLDQQPAMASQYGVSQVPTFVMVANGREVGRQVGTTSPDRLVQMFQQAGFAPQQPANPPPTARLGVRSQEPGVRSQESGVRSQPQQPSSPPPLGAAEFPPALIARLTQATVRLRVKDANGVSNGTGTIIDTHGDEALVLTCGHIFRDAADKGEIAVDVFGPQPIHGAAGQLLAYDLKRDVALVCFKPGGRVTVAKVAGSGAALSRGERVASLGCDHGEPPTARLSKINDLNKFLGPDNVTVDGEPVQGRSGGGLFNARGEIVGVCNAADPTDREGLFAALTTVHAQLDDAKLSFVYRGDPAPPQTMPSRTTPPAAAPTAVPTASALVAAQQAASAARAEVVCVVRSLDDPRAKSDVFVLDRVSPEFLRQLQQEHATQQGRVATSQRTPTATATATVPASPKPATDLKWRKPAAK